jgi:hypothetical protein
MARWPCPCGHFSGTRIQERGSLLPLRMPQSEVTMVWGLIRFALFTGSFMVGLLYFGHGARPVQPRSAEATEFRNHRTHKVEKETVDPRDLPEMLRNVVAQVL